MSEEVNHGRSWFLFEEPRFRALRTRARSGCGWSGKCGSFWFCVLSVTSSRSFLTASGITQNRPVVIT